jgi:Uma2 family endonuclease
MPATLEPIEALATPPQKKWTRDECAALEQAGFLELARYELIEGDLLVKMGKNYAHSVALLLLANWLRETFGKLQVIQENALDLRPEDYPSSEPEPDLIVLRRPFTELGGKPRPSDVLLVAEVSGASLQFDLTRKAKLYARSEVTEYWVLDVGSRRVIVHRNPVEGTYISVDVYAGNEAIASLARPDVSARVSELFQV